MNQKGFLSVEKTIRDTSVVLGNIRSLGTPDKNVFTFLCSCLLSCTSTLSFLVMGQQKTLDWKCRKLGHRFGWFVSLHLFCHCNKCAAVCF